MVVLDLAIYAKAVEVMWQKQEELNRVVIRLGAFHTAFHLSLLLGNDSNVQGLRISLLNQMLLLLGQKGVVEGKHYSRDVRAHKIVSESFWRLKWESFVTDSHQGKIQW